MLNIVLRSNDLTKKEELLQFLFFYFTFHKVTRMVEWCKINVKNEKKPYIANTQFHGKMSKLYA